MSVELSNIKAKYVSENPASKKTEDLGEDTISSEEQQNLFQSKLDFIRSISSDDNSREGSDSQDRSTNEVGSTEDTGIQDQSAAAFNGLEANIAQKPLTINQETIGNLSEMYPHNDGVADLQASLTATINSGRKIEDMPEEIKDQLKLIFNPK
jgi:hypothetical protein